VKAKSIEDDLKAQLSELDRRVEAAADRVLAVDDSLVVTMQAALAKLKAQRDALAARIAESKAEAKKLRSAKDIAAGLWDLNAVLASGDTARVRLAIGRLIERVRFDFAPKTMKVQHVIRQRYAAVGGAIRFEHLRQGSLGNLDRLTSKNTVW
jgi:hypothetical protein